MIAVVKTPRNLESRLVTKNDRWTTESGVINSDHELVAVRVMTTALRPKYQKIKRMGRGILFTEVTQTFKLEWRNGKGRVKFESYT